MKKTLYEVLEVSEKASKEVIEKAYRVLAKKYHPDLQEEGNRQEAEEHMKEINEAYSILSDEAKRKEYDNKLAAEKQYESSKREASQQTHTNQNYQSSSSQKYRTSQRTNNQNNYTYNSRNQEEHENSSQKNNENNSYKRSVKNQPNNENEADDYDIDNDELNRREEILRQREQIRENLQAQYERKYQQAYEDYLRSLGYKIKYKWTWENYRDLIIAILSTVIVGIFLWFFPPTKKLLINFYNSNPIVTTIIDTILGIIKGLWNSICSIFKK